MNNLFNKLIELLNEEFRKFELDETVQLSLSKIPKFDMQINNLVKYNKTKYFKKIQRNIIEIIDSTNLFQPIEEKDIGFEKLMFNNNNILKKKTN